MRKLILLLLILGFAVSVSAQSVATYDKPNRIKGGFYMKFGPSFPVGPFKTLQIDGRTFEPAKVGFFGDFGYLIYIGPAFANKFLRAGMDLTFLTAGFHASHHNYLSGESKIDYYYFFLGQKMGPLVTINPVDHLMIDLSWKLGFYAAEYNDDWGSNLVQQEISLGLRYKLAAFSVNYHFGKINYNDFEKANPEQWAYDNAVKIMVGLKF